MNKCIDEQRLKDKEIIDGLKQCKDSKCIKCPFNNGGASCIDSLNENALQLILKLKADVNNYRTRVGNQREELARLNEQVNEQKAEIEWLEKLVAGKQTTIDELSALITDTCEDCKVKLEANKVKSEAITEFAESLCEDRVSNDPVVIAVKTELKFMKERF